MVFIASRTSDHNHVSADGDSVTVCATRASLYLAPDGTSCLTSGRLGVGVDIFVCDVKGTKKGKHKICSFCSVEWKRWGWKATGYIFARATPFYYHDMKTFDVITARFCPPIPTSRDSLFQWIQRYIQSEHVWLSGSKLPNCAVFSDLLRPGRACSQHILHLILPLYFWRCLTDFIRS